MKAIRQFINNHRDGFHGLLMMHAEDHAILFTSALQALLAAWFPYIELFFSALIIDALIRMNYKSVPILIVGLVLFNLLMGVFIDALNQINTYKADKVHRAMVKKIDKKAMELDYEEMEDAGLLQKISDSMFIMEHIGGYDVFISYYRKLVENVIRIITSLALIVQLSISVPLEPYHRVATIFSSVPVSLSIIFSLTILNILASKFVSSRSKAYLAKGYQEKMKVERKLNYYTDEVFMNFSMGKDVRLFNMLELILTQHSRALRDSLNFYNKYYYDVDRDKESFFTICRFVYTIVAYVIVMCKVLVGAISIGDLSKYIGSINIFNQALTDCIEINHKIALQTEFVKNFQEFLGMKNAKATGTQTIQENKDEDFCLEFHDVSFKYRHSEEYTLKHVSFKISAKSKIAIVGKNGAGKTTLIKLLCRLYEPTDGYITLNGIDIKKYTYEEYQKLFSVVFQDFHLFSLPVAENVAVNKAIEGEKVWCSLELAGVADSVKRFPKSIHTNLFKLDQDGVNVSGGEAQKIAIARALYKDSPVVILDEPTAALDPVSEYEVFRSFDKLVQGKSSIFISHRMGSCRFCKEILVLDEGHIVQQGSHEELIKQTEGLYAILYFSQADHYA